MTREYRWQDIAAWLPGTKVDRATRLKRFSVILDHYRVMFGEFPLIIKVAGTSGKGSTSAMLEAFLRKDGKRVGLFTSPHLVNVSERMRVDGSDASVADLDEASRDLSCLIASLAKSGGEDCRPSVFEIWLLVALRLFSKMRVDIAILEAGVGGYNDVVSLVPGVVSVVTSIGYDHVNDLGPTLADIAADKAGIASRGSVLVLGPAIDSTIAAVIHKDGRSRGISIRQASRDTLKGRDLGLHGYEIAIAVCDLKFNLALAGDFQLDNLATVVEVASVLLELGLAKTFESLTGVASTRWFARMEFFGGRPAWLIDAGHNVLAFNELKRFIIKWLSGRPLTLVFGTSDVGKMESGLLLLGPLFDRICLVEGFYRAVSDAQFEMLRDVVRIGSPEEMVAIAMKEYVHQEQTLVVSGSVFLAGACRRLIVDRGYSPLGG